MKALIAEDDAPFRNLMKDILVDWGYEVVVARDGAEAWRALQSPDPPRLVILDWMMPELDGVEVCRRIRDELDEPYTYIILMTAHQSDEDLIAGMEAGADDYLVKPFKHSELKVRLRAGRRIIELQSELLAAQVVLKDKACRDSLTGLLNHEEILAALGKELARAERHGQCVGVIMADIDHFKRVNDDCGHLAGDAVLRLSAGRMKTLMRLYDAIGRYGGEEFLVVLADCSRDLAVSLAERIRCAIGDAAMDTPEGMIRITLSLGVTVSGPGGAQDADALVRTADAALYAAKRAGKDRVETYG